MEIIFRHPSGTMNGVYLDIAIDQDLEHAEVWTTLTDDCAREAITRIVQQLKPAPTAPPAEDETHDQAPTGT